MKREYKYYPADFKPLPVKVFHMDLVFHVFNDHTNVSSDLKALALKDLKELALDAWDLKILKVTCDKADLSFEVKPKENKLVLSFKNVLKKDKEFIIHTESVCRPTKNILEGLYYDATPEGQPPTQITQCQQWGFQRLVPCFDDMTAKCTYVTKIIADKKYTHLITNGDVLIPKKTIGNRSEIVYSNIKTPMAPYLFFLGVGTYDTYQRKFVYPDGTAFTIELLVFPGSEKSAAEQALDILVHGISWVHIYTGPDCYENLDKRDKLFALLIKRSDMIKSLADVSKISSEISLLASKLKLGYKYTGSVYREIAMQNSNFGGMENVGNTTITANRIMPTEFTTDGALEYMMRVKVHEFYHNINGSEVTAKNPFELWLNEAATVFVDQKYLEFIMGSDYARLAEVLRIIDPSYGTIEEDSGALTMPIKADGFNSPNELISNVTYSKAPEFLRMIETIIGKDKFVRALGNYQERFMNSNASSDDWIAAMEEVSVLSLKKMAESWLTQTGFPKVFASAEYKNKAVMIKVKQEGAPKMNWEFPIDCALLTGKESVNQTKVIKKSQETITFKDVKKPEIISLNRGYSFYGKFYFEQTKEALYKQAAMDSDVMARYSAFYTLAEQEKIRLLDKGEVDPKFVDLYFSILSDKKLVQSVGSLLLAITASVEDERKACMYEELFLARQKISMAIAKKYQKQLLSMYSELQKFSFEGDFVSKQSAYIKNRQVKNLCLTLLAKLDSKESHSLIKEQFVKAQNATDKLVAFGLYLNSSAKDKMLFLEDYEKISSLHPVSYEAFLSIIGGCEADDAIELIKKAEGSEFFKIEEVNHSRALYLTFAHNRRKSLQTKDGLDYLKTILIKLAPVNEYLAAGILKVLSKLELMQEKYQPDIVAALLEVLETLDENKVPSLYNNIRKLLTNSPNALKAYEKLSGKSLEKLF